MNIRYIVQNDSMKPSYPWCHICSFAALEDAKAFIISEKKLNKKVEYRILKETTEEIIENEYGSITDEEIDAFGKFSDYQKKIIKEEYAKHEKGTFPNPMCALY